MASGKSIIISLLLLILNLIFFINYVNGDGKFSNSGELIGFVGVIFFFFVTLQLLLNSSEEATKEIKNEKR